MPEEDGNKKKRCIYCGHEFSKIEFPETFEERVTCGMIECMGQRKRDLIRENKYTGNEIL